ncbi:hypothetical protein AAE478_004813 [Parahypoxylon ruwenzoriense]
MSAEEDTRSSFVDRRTELQKLQNRHRRLQTYLAICKYDFEVERKERDLWAKEGWVSRRARRRRERAQEKNQPKSESDNLFDLRAILGIPSAPSPTPSEINPGGRRKQDALDRRIQSYKKRIRRTSVQLLVAAAAGYQYRETNLATRDGRLADGIDPAIPRRYRALDVRRTPNLSSTEAAARAIKTWVNRERAKRAHPDEDSESDSADGERISLENTDDDDAAIGMAIAMASQVESATGQGDWADRAVAPAVRRLLEELPPDEVARRLYGNDGPSSRRPNEPAVPDPEVYDPRRWRRRFDTGDVPSFSSSKFKQPQSRTPTGWLTWKEQDEMYPTIDSVIRPKRIYPSDLWDPDLRIDQEGHENRRPLTPDLTTKLVIERQIGSERQEVNVLYTNYSQTPETLPERLSDEEMKRGPLPRAPELPLIGSSGFSVSLEVKPQPKIPVMKYPRGPDLSDKTPLPVAQYHYPIDSPATSTFKFSDGRGVSDIFKIAEAGEDGRIRGSKTLQEESKKIVAAESIYKKPYEYGNVPDNPVPWDLHFGRPIGWKSRSGLGFGPRTNNSTAGSVGPTASIGSAWKSPVRSQGGSRRPNTGNSFIAKGIQPPPLSFSKPAWSYSNINTQEGTAAPDTGSSSRVTAGTMPSTGSSFDGLQPTPEPITTPGVQEEDGGGATKTLTTGNKRPRPLGPGMRHDDELLDDSVDIFREYNAAYREYAAVREKLVKQNRNPGESQEFRRARERYKRATSWAQQMLKNQPSPRWKSTPRPAWAQRKSRDGRTGGKGEGESKKNVKFNLPPGSNGN